MDGFAAEGTWADLMWRIPVSLFGGGGVVSLEFLIDEHIGDLFTYLGSPSAPVEVTITANNADVSSVWISSSFSSGSTFTLVGTNGGRFIGLGGDGDDGGDDDGASGSPGLNGSNGSAATNSSGFNVDIDIDDGYLIGGGGGGGGGSYNDTGAGGTPGGGGGGGIGWGDAAGGPAGSPTGSPVASAGSAGSQATAGNGGAGGSSGVNDGGNGGGWGLAGTEGDSANPCVDDLVAGICDGNGGSGGDGGSAFWPGGGAIMTFSGAKSEATLRTENRIKGETEGNVFLADLFVIGNHVGMGHPSKTYGFLFNTDGSITKRNTDTGDTTTYWWSTSGAAVTGADYEVRYLASTAAGDGWDTEPTPIVPDAWFSLGSQRIYTYATPDATKTAGAMFQIRRTDETLPVASGHLQAYTTYEP
jgi:hypothetical protein